MTSSSMFPFFPPEKDVLSSLQVLNPRRVSSLNINNDYTSQNRTISFESYGEYRKRVLTRLEIERYVKDSLSLEDRVICTLITQHQVFITSTGKIVLNEVSLYLQKRGIPSLIIKRIVSFCESLIRRYPATSYCWKCGKVDPFTRLPKILDYSPRDTKKGIKEY